MSEPSSEYEERTVRLIHEAMPWRARSKEAWLNYHHERMRAAFAVLDATPTWDSEAVKALIRQWF